MKLQRINILCLGMLCLFLWLNIAQGIAQNTDSHLTGHVLDETTGEHLPFVTVQVKGTNIGTATDESGHFLLTNLSLGEHTIIFSYVGYESKEQPVVVISNMTTEIKVSIHERMCSISKRASVWRKHAPTAVYPKCVSMDWKDNTRKSSWTHDLSSLPWLPSMDWSSYPQEWWIA